MLTGVELNEIALTNKLSVERPDGFVGLALIQHKIEAVGRWPLGLLDAYIVAMPTSSSTHIECTPCCRSDLGVCKLGQPQYWFYSWVLPVSVQCWYKCPLCIPGTLKLVTSKNCSVRNICR